MSLTVRELFEGKKETLELETLTDETGFDRSITVPEVS